MFCGPHHNHNGANTLKAETHTRYKVCNMGQYCIYHNIAPEKCELVTAVTITQYLLGSICHDYKNHMLLSMTVAG